MRVYLISTSEAEHLAKRVKRLQPTHYPIYFEVIFPTENVDGKRYFPNGEVYVKILNLNKLENRRVIALHSGTPKPNEGLIELELILQILKESGIKPEVFFTYFPYGMQDEIFEKGETNVSKNLIEKLVNYYKVKKIYIIDAHFLIKEAQKDFGKDILFLSPDIGGARRTKIAGMKKERLDSYRVKMISPKLNLKGEIVGIIDDLIKTGGTLIKTYQECKKSGAKRIIALVTHGVLPSGIQKIKRKYSRLYLTNTIKQKESNIDITDLILNTFLKHD